MKAMKTLQMMTMVKAVMALMFVAALPAAYAGFAELNNEKGSCVFLKNGKVAKKSVCYADGTHSANVVMGGWILEFKPIAGYGKITVDYAFESKTDANDILVTDADGQAIIVREEININDKPATLHYRHAKSLKPISNDTFWESDGHYQCFVAKDKPADEFCTSVHF